MATATCAVELADFSWDCLARDKKTGVRGALYFGDRRELATVTFGTNGEITGLTMNQACQMWKIEGMNSSHKIDFKSVQSGSKNAMFECSVEANFYVLTQAQIAAIEKLVQLKYAFVFYITNEGLVKAAGIDKHPVFTSDLFDQRGLMAQDGSELNEGIQMAEDQPFKIMLKGQFYNTAKVYMPTGATGVTAIIAALEAYLTPAT